MRIIRITIKSIHWCVWFNDSGKRVSVSVPMQVVQVASSSGYMRSLLAGLFFAIGGFFIYLVLRRRDDEPAMRLSADR